MKKTRPYFARIALAEVMRKTDAMATGSSAEGLAERGNPAVTARRQREKAPKSIRGAIRIQ